MTKSLINPAFADPPSPAASMFDDLPDNDSVDAKARHDVVRELARLAAENARLTTTLNDFQKAYFSENRRVGDLGIELAEVKHTLTLAQADFFLAKRDADRAGFELAAAQKDAARLARYADHLDTCRMNLTGRSCDCGLGAALAAHREASNDHTAF